jgi:ADP-ribose pyrophosphatase YjhB (NUDIX family)
MKIEVLVRAIIRDKGRFLVCKKKGKKYCFFPGGHVEFGESAEKALKREIKEELGLNIKKCSFIGGSEHLFTEDGKKRHEINLAFWVPIKKINTKSNEDHLQFFLMNKNQLVKEKVLPTSLTKALLRWLKDKKPFWVSEI